MGSLPLISTESNSKYSALSATEAVSIVLVDEEVIDSFVLFFAPELPSHPIRIDKMANGRSKAISLILVVLTYWLVKMFTRW